jgi:hypothetical protein
MKPLTCLFGLPWLLLTSCAGGFGQAAADRVDALASVSMRSVLPARVPVVAVREAELVAFPLGADRALAYERQRVLRRGQNLRPPATFLEPVLPMSAEGEVGFGVLPVRPQ